MAQNHTGTIATNETWTLANSPHHLTGNVTVNAGVTLTIQAGCDVIFDADYSITVNGVIIANGTPSSRINFYSGAAAPLFNSITRVLVWTNMQAGSSLTYAKIMNCNGGFYMDGAPSNPTIDHVEIEACYFGIYMGLNNSASITMTNMYVHNCAYGLSFSNANTWTWNMSYFQVYDCDFCVNYQAMPTGVTCNWSYGEIAYSTQQNVFGFKQNLDYMFLHDVSNFQLTTTTANTWDNCILINSRNAHVFAGSGDCVFTNCDIGMNNIVAATALFQTGGSFNTCAIFGGKWKDKATFDSGDGGTDDGTMNTTSTLGMLVNVDSISGILSARNHVFTASAITESSLGDNGVTIEWTVTFPTKHRIRYGTVSGTYTTTNEPEYTFSNYLGGGNVVTLAPSIALVNLKAGTKYYYVVESFDYTYNAWVTSAEGDFTTTSSGASITNVTIDDTSISTSESVTATIMVSGTPTIVGVRINSKDFEASGSGTTYTVTVKGSDIGVGSTFAVVGYATNSSGGSASYTSSSTLTVTTASYTDYMYNLLQDIQALLRSEFPNIPVLIGDRAEIKSKPTIILEPYGKDTEAEISYGKKDMAFDVRVYVYSYTSQDEQAVKVLSDLLEEIEQVLLNNLSSPSATDGSDWHTSKPSGAEYGTVLKAGEQLRTALIKWTFKKRAVR